MFFNQHRETRSHRVYLNSSHNGITNIFFPKISFFFIIFFAHLKKSIIFAASLSDDGIK